VAESFKSCDNCEHYMTLECSIIEGCNRKEALEAYKNFSGVCPDYKQKQQHKKKSKKEETVQHSPGIAKDGVVFEQIKDGEYVYGKKFEEAPIFQIDGVTFQPLLRCPWHLATKPIAYSSSHELFNDIRKFIYDHLFLPNAELYDVLTAWVLATWIRELWSVVPYIFFYGPIASGKTRGLEVLHRLCFRGILASNISSAALFRASEEWHPTLLLDETEIYSKETKTEVIGLLNSGYRRGQHAIRVKQTQQGSELEAFDVFGFKALAGTQGLAQALESRSIMIRMIKARREVVRVIDEKRATEIRNKLLGWRLYTLAENELSELFSEGIGSLNFGDGRLIELFSCLLAVSNEGRENIEKYAHKVYEMRNSEQKASEEAEIVEILSKNGLISEKNVALTREIADTFNSSRKEKEHWKTRSVGWLVRKLGFEKVHTGQGNGCFIDRERLTYLQQIYGITENPLPPPPEKVQKVHEPIDDAFASLCCFGCHKPLDRKSESYTYYEGELVCFDCYHKLKDQEKKPKCKNLTTLEGDPYCKFLESLLIDPKKCDPSCAGWELQNEN